MQDEHHGDHPAEGDDVAQDRDDAGREDLADRLDVAEDPRHHAPDGIPIEERGRQPLDVGEERRPEVVDDALPGPRREVDLGVAEGVLDRQGQEEQRHDVGQPGPVAAEDVGVDGDLDEVRLDEVHRRQEREQERREDDRAPVRARVGPDPPREPRVVDAADGVVVLPGPDAAPASGGSRVAWPPLIRPPRRSTRAADAATAARRRPGRARSSAWVPSSTIRPSSRTTMRSSPAATRSRWVMTSVVRPWMRARRRSRIIASVSASTAAKASSRMRIRGSRRRARARVARWRCPPESVRPRSPTRVSQPPGKLATSGERPATSAAARHAGIRRAERDVLAERPGEEERLLRHDADRGPEVPQRDRVDLPSVDEDRAGRRIPQPGQERGQRALPGARRSHDRDGAARLDAEAQVAERGRPVRRVAERQPADLDLAPHGAAERRRLGPVEDPRARVEDLGHPAERREPPADDRQHPAERHRGPREVGDVAGEGHEHAEREAPLQDRPSADPEDAQGADAGHDREERREEAVGPRLAEDAGEVLLVQSPELLDLARRERVGAHDRHPAQVLLGLGREVRQLLLDGDRLGVGAGVVAAGHGDEQRVRREGGQGEPGVHAEHDDQGSRVDDRRVDEGQEAEADEHRDALEVVGRPRHEVARFAGTGRRRARAGGTRRRGRRGSRSRPAAPLRAGRDATPSGPAPGRARARRPGGSPIATVSAPSPPTARAAEGVDDVLGHPRDQEGAGVGREQEQDARRVPRPVSGEVPAKSGHRHRREVYRPVRGAATRRSPVVRSAA